MTSLHSTHKKQKNKVFGLRTLKTTKMIKMAGVTQVRLWFAEAGFSQPRKPKTSTICAAIITK